MDDNGVERMMIDMWQGWAWGNKSHVWSWRPSLNLQYPHKRQNRMAPVCNAVLRKQQEEHFGAITSQPNYSLESQVPWDTMSQKSKGKNKWGRHWMSTSGHGIHMYTDTCMCTWVYMYTDEAKESRAKVQHSLHPDFRPAKTAYWNHVSKHKQSKTKINKNV